MGSDELVNREAKGVNSHSIVYSWIRLPLSTEHVLGSRGILVLRRVEDKVTGRRIPLDRNENLYVMKAWVRADPGSDRPPKEGSPFGGQAQ